MREIGAHHIMTDHDKYPVQGEVKIQLDKFPREILDAIFQAGSFGRLPVLNLQIDELFMNGDGVEMQHNLSDQSTVTLHFVGRDVKVELA